MRLDLIEASKKRDIKSINYMMARTYSLRRMEVVAQSPDVAKLKERWPALFEPFQVNDLSLTCCSLSFCLKANNSEQGCLCELDTLFAEHILKIHPTFYGVLDCRRMKGCQFFTHLECCVKQLMYYR